MVTAAYVINPPQPDFFFGLNPASLSVYDGGTATSSITASAVDGFSGSCLLPVPGCLLARRAVFHLHP